MSDLIEILSEGIGAGIMLWDDVDDAEGKEGKEEE